MYKSPGAFLRYSTLIRIYNYRLMCGRCAGGAPGLVVFGGEHAQRRHTTENKRGRQWRRCVSDCGGGRRECLARAAIVSPVSSDGARRESGRRGGRANGSRCFVKPGDVRLSGFLFGCRRARARRGSACVRARRDIIPVGVPFFFGVRRSIFYSNTNPIIFERRAISGEVIFPWFFRAGSFA